MSLSLNIIISSISGADQCADEDHDGSAHFDSDVNADFAAIIDHNLKHSSSVGS